MSTSLPKSVEFAAPSPIIAHVGVSLATMPLLVGVMGGQAIASSLQALGVLSEEIFRGDRLPLLDLSPSTQPPASVA